MSAALTRADRLAVEARGCRVTACFEEDFDAIQPAEVPKGYLLTSYPADRFLGRFSVARRLEILGKEIAFWRRLLEECKPVAAVNELVALEISEVLLVESLPPGPGAYHSMNCVVDDLFYWAKDPIKLSGSDLGFLIQTTKRASRRQPMSTRCSTRITSLSM